MEIVKIKGQYYCKVKHDFDMQKIEKSILQIISVREGSFAEQYTKKIFSDFFKSARDLRREYNNYYALEYDTFEQFLFQKELMEISDIRSLGIQSDENLLRLQMHKDSYNADIWFEYDETGTTSINEILKEISL